MPRSAMGWVAGLALLAQAAACGDVLGPPGEGTYVLTEIDGSSPPFRWHAGDVIVEIVSDTLTISADGRVRQATVLRRRATVAQTIVSDLEVAEGELVEQEGRTVLLYDICRPESLALCVRAPTVLMSASTIEVRWKGRSYGVTRYEPARDERFLPQ